MTTENTSSVASVQSIVHTPGPWTLGDENNQCCGEVMETLAAPQGQGEMMKTKRQWKRQPWGDRYKLTSGEWEITAVGVGHDEVRSYYILKCHGVLVDEFDKLRDAKSAVEWYL